MAFTPVGYLVVLCSPGEMSAHCTRLAHKGPVPGIKAIKQSC